MRPFDDLDQAIDACERRVATHRRHLADALHDSNVRVRHRVASPKVLIGAVLAGYLVGRLIDRSRAEPAAGGKTAGIAGVLGALAISLLRGQLATPGSWIHNALMQRKRAHPPAGDPHVWSTRGHDSGARDVPNADAAASTANRPPVDRAMGPSVRGGSAALD